MEVKQGIVIEKGRVKQGGGREMEADAGVWCKVDGNSSTFLPDVSLCAFSLSQEMRN